MPQNFEEQFASTRYFDRNFSSEAVKILPGEYAIGHRELMLVTTLGSCVAACVRDPAKGIGGMNHFMLPGEDHHQEKDERPLRYGVYAMEVLISHLQKMGARRNSLEAKVFGGGAVIPGAEHLDIGARNAEFVLNYLQTEKIPVVAKDLLGAYPRKVYFSADTGKVLVRKLRQLNNTTLFDREVAYRSRLSAGELHGDIELFS